MQLVPTMLKLAICFLLVMQWPSLANAQDHRIPAEWEKQERVLLSWFGAIRRDTVTCRVIEALQPRVDITLYIWHDSIRHRVNKKLASYNVDTNRLNIQIDEYADFWTRDPLVFVEHSDQLQVACFDWSAFGLFPQIMPGPIPAETRLYGELDERFAAHVQLPVIKSDFVFEGGGIESDGKGTIMSIKEMALQRNPSKTLAEIEAELRRVLGVKKFIWLKDGLIEDRLFQNQGPFFKNYFGGGANMHIDEICRFVNDSTVVLPYIPFEEKDKSPIDSINYDMLEANYQILQQATTWDGRKLNIVRIPMPEIELLKFTFTVDSNSYEQMKVHGFEMGDTIYRVPAASYCNFFISNDVVLVQKYWKPGMPDSQRLKDEESIAIFTELFPGRKIIPIFTHSINRGGGGIHCMTHEIPAKRN
jgi:agmatine deiminase